MDKRYSSEQSGQVHLLVSLYAIILALMLCPSAQGVTITFEGLPDSAPVGDFYESLGVHFGGTTTLTAGFSLNEIDFPPHSGSVAVADDGSPISISFDSPVTHLSAYFVNLEQLTFTALDSHGDLVGIYVNSLITDLGTEQWVSLDFTGVSLLQISSSEPTSYIMDDLSFEVIETVPENTATGFLLILALGAITLASKIATFATSIHRANVDKLV